MKTIQTAALAAAVALAPLMASSSGALAVDKSAVLTTYADIAHAAYGDSLSTAETLLQAVDKLLADPGDETLAAARQAWVAARAPYQQTEAYRFGNAIVHDWEGKVNAWTLDEGLIDYVDQASYGSDSDDNQTYPANVVHHEKQMVNDAKVAESQSTKEE